MSSNGSNNLTIPHEVIEQLTLVMDEYDCDSLTDAISTASSVALSDDGVESTKPDVLSKEDTQEDSTPPREVIYSFENPDHPDSAGFHNQEEALQRYRAARYIQGRLGTDRHDLVDDFLIAVQKHEKGEGSALEEFLRRVTG
jgi:hypothetical protein